MARGQISRKISPWQWVVIGVGLALLGLLIRGSFEPFSVFAFILAGGFERFFRTRRYSNWLSVGCGLLVALGVKWWVVDFKVVKSESLAPRIQQNARVFYQPVFFMVQRGDIVIVRQENPASPSRNYIGQVGKMIDRNTYEIVRVADNRVVAVERSGIIGKVIGVANPSE